jgi:hypothetical protein
MITFLQEDNIYKTIVIEILKSQSGNRKTPTATPLPYETFANHPYRRQRGTLVE